jgi:hypothetical protein
LTPVLLGDIVLVKLSQLPYKFFMDQDTKEVFQQLGQKMDILAALLLRLVPKNHEGLSLKDQIRLLDGLGMRPIDIAKVVGRGSNHVNKELVAIRREK